MVVSGSFPSSMPLTGQPERLSWSSGGNLIRPSADHDFTQSYIAQDASNVKMWPIGSDTPMSARNNPWSSFYGIAKKDIGTDPEKSYAEEIRDLPDAYDGVKSELMGKILISQMTATRSFWVNEICPYQRTNQITTNKKLWIFKDEFLGQVPEQGVPHLIRNNMTERSATVTRKGIGAYNEHMFLSTEMGQKGWWFQLEQMNYATTDTACHEIATKLYACDEGSHFRAARGGLTFQQFDDILEQNIAMWGVLQKNDRGFEFAVGKARETMKDRVHQNGNLLIMPAGCESYTWQGQVLDNVLLRTGIRSDMKWWQNVEQAMVLRESRKFNGYDDLGADPAYNNRLIGSFHTMTMKLPALAPPEKWSLRQYAATEIWNENNDGFHVQATDLALFNKTGFAPGISKASPLYNMSDIGAGLNNNPNNHNHYDPFDSLPYHGSSDSQRLEDPFGDWGTSTQITKPKKANGTIIDPNDADADMDTDMSAYSELLKYNPKQKYAPWARRWFEMMGWKTHGDAYEKQGLLDLLVRCINTNLNEQDYKDLFHRILYPSESASLDADADGAGPDSGTRPPAPGPGDSSSDSDSDDDDNRRKPTHRRHVSISRNETDTERKYTGRTETPHPQGQVPRGLTDPRTITYPSANLLKGPQVKNGDIENLITALTNNATKPTKNPFYGLLSYVGLGRKRIVSRTEDFATHLKWRNERGYTTHYQDLLNLVKPKKVPPTGQAMARDFLIKAIGMDINSGQFDKKPWANTDPTGHALLISISPEMRYDLIENVFVRVPVPHLVKLANSNALMLFTLSNDDFEAVLDPASHMDNPYAIVLAKGATTKEYSKLAALVALSVSWYSIVHDTTTLLDNKQIAKYVNVLTEMVNTPDKKDLRGRVILAQAFTSTFILSLIQGVLQYHQLSTTTNNPDELKDNLMKSSSIFKAIFAAAADTDNPHAMEVAVREHVGPHPRRSATTTTTTAPSSSPQPATETQQEKDDKLIQDKLYQVVKNLKDPHDEKAKAIDASCVSFTSKNLHSIWIAFRSSIDKSKNSIRFWSEYIDDETFKKEHTAPLPVLTNILRVYEELRLEFNDPAEYDAEMSEIWQRLIARILTGEDPNPQLRTDDILDRLLTSKEQLNKNELKKELRRYRKENKEAFELLKKEAMELDPIREQYDHILSTNTAIQLGKVIEPIHPLKQIIGPGGSLKRLSHSMLKQVLLERTPFDSYRFFQWVVEHDLPVCFGVISWRPNQEWEMGSMCLTMGGGEVGRHLVMMPDFQLQNDSVRKVMIANFTIYMGTMIEDPRKVVIIPDVFCRTYRGGWGISEWDASNPAHHDLQARNPRAFDMYHTIVEATFQAPKWMQLNGRMPSQIRERRHPAAPEYSYSTAPFYTEYVWRNWKDDHSNIVTSAYDAQANTLCFQDYQGNYNPISPAQAYITHNKGPWGKSIYEGSASARRNGGSRLHPPNTLRVSLVAMAA